MGRLLQTIGAILGTGAGILACTFLTALLFLESQFLGGIPRLIATVGVVFWGLLSVAGFRIRSNGRRREQEQEAVRYKLALDALVRRNLGRVTALELATALGVDIAQARAYLDLLVKDGEATHEMTEQFTQYYQVGPVLAPPPPPPPSPPVPPVRGGGPVRMGQTEG